MLYRVGNSMEAANLPMTMPNYVRDEFLRCVALFDVQYGLKRDYLETGGYFLFAETSKDVLEAKKFINYDTHPCEWVNRLGGDYLSALFVINNDFAIGLFMPMDAAPDAILDELEDWTE